MASSESKNSADDLKVDAEKQSSVEAPGAKAAADAHYDPTFVAKTLRHIDWRILPLLGLLYSVSLIDRTNLGVARITGMDGDLQLSIGERYSIASMIYFPPYIILQLPSNIALSYFGAQVWLTICVVGWGAAQIGMAFVPNWGLLCLTRVFLGIFEAGFFPALVFIIQTWYKRSEVQKRLAAFYLISIVLGGFSAILAYAFHLLRGRGGLNGWQWIFLLEGVITIALGVLTWMFVPDFPSKSKFLNAEQTKMVLDRVEADRGDSIPDAINLKVILKHLSDPFLWSFALMFMASTMPAYAIGFFITILLLTMGFNITEALVLTAPPYVAAAISCFFFAWLSDKTKKRAPWLAVQNLITITGLMITGYAKPNGARYFGLFLVNMGASGCVPGVLAYNANNVTSHSKRSVSTAVIIAFGGIGGIFATLVYRQVDAPLYIPGIWATMACQFAMLILLGVNTLVFTRRNNATREGKRVNEDTPGFFQARCIVLGTLLSAYDHETKLSQHRGGFYRESTGQGGLCDFGNCSLDTAGFQYYHHPAKHTSFQNEEEIQKEYYPESVELIKKLSGASKVVLFDNTIRRNPPGELDDDPTKRQPVAQVHVDRTPKPATARD